MNEKRMFALVDQLWSDLHATDFVWQALALLLVLAVAWWLSYRLRKGGEEAHESAEAQSALRQFGAGSLKRIAFPLIALTLVWVLRKVLVALHWEHLSLLYLAGPLLVSLALARMFAYVLRRVLPQGMFLTQFERIVTVVIWLGVILHLTGLAEPLIEALEQVSFRVGKQKFDLWMLLRGSVTVCVTLLVALWIASLVERRLMLVSEIDGNVRVVLARLAKALLSVIAVLFSLSLLGIDVTTLSVFSGALAVGVAGHLYQWLSGRPAVLVETPGLITLVPGSLGFRGLHALMQQESVVGINLMTDMLTTGAVLAVGLLLADNIMPLLLRRESRELV